jgi:hypothetical protein
MKKECIHARHRKKNTEYSALHPPEGAALLVEHFHLMVVVEIGQ